jgi:hypothetical protein
MDCVVWESVPVGNACVLESIENVERAPRLRTGLAFASAFPKDAQFRMSREFKKDTALTDDISNGTLVKVCSPKLVEFLQKLKVPGVEYLPVRILDHKGKVASADYRIVNPCPPQDVLDVKASGPRYSQMLKTEIVELKKLVVDPRKLEPGVRIFRIKGFTKPVLVDRKLAEAMEAEGFVGPAFTELDEYET